MRTMSGWEIFREGECEKAVGAVGGFISVGAGDGLEGGNGLFGHGVGHASNHGQLRAQRDDVFLAVGGKGILARGKVTRLSAR